MAIYFLKHRSRPILVLGTAERIAGDRKAFAAVSRGERGELRLPDFMHHLESLPWMLDPGDESDVDPIVKAWTTPSSRWDDPPWWGTYLPYVVITPFIFRWIERHGTPWNGQDARLLGVKAPSREKDRRGAVGRTPPRLRPDPAPRPILDERLARARVRLVGLGPQWNGPVQPGRECPTCGGSVAGLEYCLHCSAAGFQVEAAEAQGREGSTSDNADASRRRKSSAGNVPLP